MVFIRRKSFAYITYKSQLLVFRHVDFPEVGIQVPAGTVRPGESPEAAALREACEETGLQGLRLANFLGEQVRDMSDCGLTEVHHRFFYHIECRSEPPAVWRHAEEDPSDGSPAPIVFELYWVNLPDGVPPLTTDHGFMLPQLIQHLEEEDCNDG
jgi:8-oxo-dGTP diphosphatase